MTHFEKYLNGLQRFGIQPGLERIRALLERFAQPHLRYPHVLVGGTNGKGSTCEFLARLLAADDTKIGLFTSPHLYQWNERIRVLNPQSPTPNPQPPFYGAITDSQLDALFCDAKPHLDAVAAELGQPTEFETLTALALWHFARAGVDGAIIEVGLGGKWDATNATDPLVSVITHVALDHCDRLGETVEEIARDKVEIARPGRVLVTAETKDSVLQIFRAHCQSIGATLKIVDVHAQPGDFQCANWQTATAAFHAFNAARGRQSSALPISLDVPGRLEIVRENPRVILDVCNNPDGAAHLAQALPRITRGRLILVLGILGDKDFESMTAQLAPLASVVIATQSHSPRAALAEVVSTAARRHCAHVATITPVVAAVQRALALAAPTDTICIAGSFTTVGEVDRRLKKL